MWFFFWTCLCLDFSPKDDLSNSLSPNPYAKDQAFRTSICEFGRDVSLLYHFTGKWLASLSILLITACIITLFGSQAGRNRTIEETLQK